MTAVLLAAALLLGQHAQSSADCRVFSITGYSRFEHGTHTADGTPITTSEPIVAASYDVPLGAYVDIEGLGRFRVADRGSGLGSAGWLDVAVWSRAEAYAITGWRFACVLAPGEVG